MGSRLKANLPMLLILALVPQNSTSGADSAEAMAFFEKKIRPVLVKHCYECHSGKAAAAGELGGGLQLDNRAGIRRGGDSVAAVVPGKPGQSLLWPLYGTNVGWRCLRKAIRCQLL